MRQASLLSRATARNSCRESIGLSKLSPDGSLYLTLAERRLILSIYTICIIEIAVTILIQYFHTKELNQIDTK